MKMKYCGICGSVAIIKEKETEFYCAKCYLIKQKNPLHFCKGFEIYLSDKSVWSFTAVS